mgnify:CR=1 FL=1
MTDITKMTLPELIELMNNIAKEIEVRVMEIRARPVGLIFLH